MKYIICIQCKGNLDPQKYFICPLCGELPQKIDAFTLMYEMREFGMKLNNKINLLRDYDKTLKLPIDDARNQFLSSFSSTLGWLSFQLNFYIKYARTKDSLIPQSLKSINPTITDKEIIENVRHYDIIHRRSFFTEILFELELFLKSISKILSKTEKKRGYYNLVTFVLKELNIGEEHDENHNIMIYPSIVRNSLHNNGVYVGYPTNGEIYGIHFYFNNDKRVKFVSWRHVYFFYDAVLDVIELILKHKQVGKRYVKSIMPSHD